MLRTAPKPPPNHHFNPIFFQLWQGALSSDEPELNNTNPYPLHPLHFPFYFAGIQQALKSKLWRKTTINSGESVKEPSNLMSKSHRNNTSMPLLFLFKTSKTVEKHKPKTISEPWALRSWITWHNYQYTNLRRPRKQDRIVPVTLLSLWYQSFFFFSCFFF